MKNEKVIGGISIEITFFIRPFPSQNVSGGEYTWLPSCQGVQAIAIE